MHAMPEPNSGCPRSRSLLLLLVLLALLVFYPSHRHDYETAESAADPVAFQLPSCMRRLRQPNDGDPLWLAVFGDSLSRGIFFDTAEVLNGSATASVDRVHPGHTANYSRDCTVFESRPPIRRQKCGGFAFDWLSPSASESRCMQRQCARGTSGSPSGLVRPVHTLVGGANDAFAGRAASDTAARLTFRLKTFAWEPEFDEQWLRSLRRGRRLPDALLLSFGIWDMQYPPENDPEKGLVAFATALRRFLAALDKALGGGSEASVRSGTASQLDGRTRRPKLYWLSVTAVADMRLPAWKRPRMSAALARRYNEVALPELRRYGVTYVDTHTSGAARADLSVDGVHFTGELSRVHARLFWEALCAKPGWA